MTSQLQIMTSSYSSHFDEMNAALSSKGTVEKEMFFLLKDAHDYDAASSVRWLETQLRVLHEQLRRGSSLTVYQPATDGFTAIASMADFNRWIGQHFPNSRDRYRHPF